MSNPFTQITTAIKSYVEAHWAALPDDNVAKVRVGNRWGKDRVKPARQPADSPAVDIRPLDGGDNKLTSSTGIFARAWELGIGTDDLEPDVLDQCQWELIRAALKMQTESLGLTSLVMAVKLDSLLSTREDTAANRNTIYWTGAVVLTVTFQVPRVEILPA